MYRFYYDEPIEEVIDYIRKETKTPNERVNYGDYYCKIKGNYIRMHKYHWLWHKKPQKSFIGTIEPYGNGTIISGEFVFPISNRFVWGLFLIFALISGLGNLFSSNSMTEAITSILMILLPWIVFCLVYDCIGFLMKVILKKEDPAVLEILGAKATRQESEELK